MASLSDCVMGVGDPGIAAAGSVGSSARAPAAAQINMRRFIEILQWRVILPDG
jgi:hypothetical protein